METPTMSRTLRLAALLAAVFALAPAPAQANFITYTWNDELSGSTFFGSFTVDTNLLPGAPGGGKLLTLAGITSSGFQFRAGGSSGAPLVFFPITGVSPSGGITIDPATGAVLDDGE